MSTQLVPFKTVLLFDMHLDFKAATCSVTDLMFDVTIREMTQRLGYQMLPTCVLCSKYKSRKSHKELINREFDVD